MVNVISVANQKGGVGKTTVTLQTIFELEKRNAKILCIDFDGQGNLSSRLLPSSFDSESDHEATRSYELYGADDFDIKPIKCRENVDLIWARSNDPELFEIESVEFERVRNPQKHLQKIIDNYDYVLIDCPPSLGRNLVAALIMSTHVVTIVKVSGFAIDGAAGLMNTIYAVQQDYNHELINVGFLVNMFDGSPTHTKTIKNLRADLDDLVFENIIRNRTPIDTATDEGIPVSSLSYAHVASREVQLAINELLERVENEYR